MRATHRARRPGRVQTFTSVQAGPDRSPPHVPLPDRLCVAPRQIRVVLSPVRLHAVLPGSRRLAFKGSQVVLPLYERVTVLLGSPLAEKAVLFAFFSRERLMPAEARPG